MVDFYFIATKDIKKNSLNEWQDEYQKLFFKQP